jgi:hypothetical protein
MAVLAVKTTFLDIQFYLVYCVTNLGIWNSILGNFFCMIKAIIK